MEIYISKLIHIAAKSIWVNMIFVIHQKKQNILICCILLTVFNIGTKTSFAQQNKIDSLIILLNTTKTDTIRVKVLSNISSAILDKKPDQAIEYGKQGLLLSKKIDFRKGQSICLNAIGLAYFQIGKFDTALIYFEERYKIVSKLNDSLGIAGTYDDIGVIYSQQGRNDKALELRTKANKIYASLNEKSLLASGYTWIGNIYKEKGEYSIALENYFKALKIYDEEKNENDIAYPLINISSIYRYLKQYDLARKYVNEAKSKFLLIKNQKGVGVSLYRLALIYNEEKDYINTVNSLTEAKRIFVEIQDTYFQTLVNLMLGTCNRSMGNNELALKYFDDALPKALQIGNKDLISSVYQNIGTVYSDKGDFQKALEYMHQSESILKEINNKGSLRDMFVNYVELYSHINKPDSVSKYLKRYQELSDVILNEQNIKSIAEMRIKYEAEMKDKEILILNLEEEKKKGNILSLQNINEKNKLELENSAIENENNTQSLKLTKAEQEKQLAKIEIYKLNEEKQAQAIKDEKDNKRLISWFFILGFLVLTVISFLGFLNFRNRKKKEKAIFNQREAELSRMATENHLKALRSQMNPHFIFNCVDSIERLLDDAKIEESKISLSNFSALIRTVLENSMKKRIPLDEEFNIIKIYMELENIRFRNPFTHNISIQSGINASTTLIPPLILQPFVENSIKHGFCNSEKPRHLKIEVQKENEFLICIIEDNGVGRKQNLNTKSLSGFKKESIGLKLTGERLQLISEIKNIKSYFLIDDLEDSFNNPLGTRIMMFLPYELSV